MCSDPRFSFASLRRPRAVGAGDSSLARRATALFVTLALGGFATASSPADADPSASTAPAPRAASPAAPSRGQVYLTVEEALKLAFPGAEVERGTAVLTEAQQKRVEKLAGVELESRIAHPYVARKKGELVGTAYFDTHRVRTLRETLMVVVDAHGHVERIEVLAFGEPKEYLPSPRWYAQFTGKELDEALRLKRDIKGITGATLSAAAATDAVRRALALHRVLSDEEPKPEPKPEPAPKPKPKPKPKPDARAAPAAGSPSAVERDSRPKSSSPLRGARLERAAGA